MSALPPYTAATTVLYVDDEAQATKWFARSFGDEFDIETAGSVDEALARLADVSRPVAVLATDYRMPERNGMALLEAAQREYRATVRLLVTAYAEKEVAIEAINRGQVFRILEKPLDLVLGREVLREALSRYRSQALAQALHEGRALAVRETLGFLAHELNTPLATVRGYMSGLRERYRPGMSPSQDAWFAESRPGEVLTALEAAERNALYCQSLVATFVKSARDAHPAVSAQAVTAADLVGVLMASYPFEEGERDWVEVRQQADFSLPGPRDLLFLVLSTLTKNALQALQTSSAPRLTIAVGADPAGGWRLQFIDNGPGIAPELLRQLTREAVTTRAGSGGSGMGLLFCRRVVQSVGGTIHIDSAPGAGTTVTLHFQPA